MADGAFIPPWLQPANPAEHLAQGYRIGIALGAQQAEQAFREQQSMRQQQESAEQKAQWEAEFGLRAKQAADKAAAIQDYQNAIAGGMDPVQAITRFGPRMQEPGAAMAAAMRMQRPSPITPFQQSELELRNRQFAETQAMNRWRQSQAEKATQPGGEVQGYPVLDPTTKQPIEGLVAFPSASGKGMTVRLTPKAEAQLTPAVASRLLEQMPYISQFMKLSAEDSKQLSDDLMDVVRKAVGGNKKATKPIAEMPKAPPSKSLWDKIVGAKTAVTQALEPAPRDPAKRVVDKVYRLPKGLFRWTGKGWLPAEEPVAAGAEPVEE